MRRRRLVLIQPSSKQQQHFYREMCYAPEQPLWASVIAALTPESRWDVTFVHEGLSSLPLMPRADLVAIGAMSHLAERAYEISRYYQLKGLPTVLGGVHASVMPDEAQRYASAVVVGEAESVWPRLIDDVEAGTMAERYVARPIDIATLRVRTRRSVYRGYRYASAAIQFSRGCSADCDFCSKGALLGRRVRHRDVGEVVAELEAVDHEYVLFVDDNIVGLGRSNRDHALALMREMDRRRIRKRWLGSTSTDVWEDDELLHWMQRTGCHMLLVGFEDVQAERTRAAGKHHSRQANDVRLVRRLHDHGIGVFGSFIAGLPGQEPADLDAIVDFCLTAEVDIPVLNNAALLPGSRWWDRYAPRARYRRFPADYANLAGGYLPVMPDGKHEPEQWLGAFRRAAERLVPWPEVWRRFRVGWARHGPKYAAVLGFMHYALRPFYERMSRADDAIDLRTGRFKLKSPLTPLPPVC